MKASLGRRRRRHCLATRVEAKARLVRDRHCTAACPDAEEWTSECVLNERLQCQSRLDATSAPESGPSPPLGLIMAAASSIDELLLSLDDGDVVTRGAQVRPVPSLPGR